MARFPFRRNWKKFNLLETIVELGKSVWQTLFFPSKIGSVTVWTSLSFKHNANPRSADGGINHFICWQSSKLQLSWHKLKPVSGNSSNTNCKLHTDYDSLFRAWALQFFPAVPFKWLFPSNFHSGNGAAAAASKCDNISLHSFFCVFIECNATNWAYFFAVSFQVWCPR